MSPYPMARVVVATLIALGVAFSTVARAAEGESIGMLEADASMVQKLLVPRASDDVEQELAVANRRLEIVEASVAEYREMTTIANRRVRIKKEEIGLLKDRLKLAKKEKDEPRAASLKSELKLQDAQLAVFARIAAAAEVQNDWARALRRSVDALKDARAAELKLTDMRSDRVRRAANPETQAKELDERDADISRAARKFADAMGEYADASEGAARAVRKMTATRLKLLDTWEKANGRRGLP
jgi:chromosome segregation ATPase